MEVDVERGERIRAFREQAGRTQEDVAGLVGVSPRVYLDWEKHGKPIRRRNLVQLAAVLGRDVRDIDPDAAAVAAVDLPAAMAGGELPEILEQLRELEARTAALEARTRTLAKRLASIEETLVSVLDALQQLVTATTQQRLETERPERRPGEPGENRGADGGSLSS